MALSTSGIDALRFRRLHQRLTAIAEDDVLLKRESLGRFLSQDQLRDALEERGMYVNFLLTVLHHSVPSPQYHRGAVSQGLANPPAVVVSKRRGR